MKHLNTPVEKGNDYFDITEEINNNVILAFEMCLISMFMFTSYIANFFVEL